MATGTVPSYHQPTPAKEEEKQEVKKSYVTNYVKGQAADYSLPQVATGGIVPFLLGREIIKSPDLAWYGNLQPIKDVKSQQTTTTDPNTGDQTITTTVTTTITGYTIDAQFCVGLGPGMRLRAILLDDAPVWTGIEGPARSEFAVANSTILSNVIFAGGNFDQAVDPYLQGLVEQDLPAYRGFAYVVLKNLNTVNLGNLAFEVDRYPDPLGLGAENKIDDDINTVSAIVEIITQEWGGAGRPLATIGPTFATLAASAFDGVNGCSIVSRQTNSANDLISILLDQLNATLWENHETGKLEITAITKDFDRENLVRLFDKDITKMDDLSKPGWQSVPTSISLKYVDRSLNYKENPLLARNLAVSTKVSKSGISLSFPAVRNGTLAGKLLSREGASAGSPVQLVQFTTNRKAAGCNPGDIILITYEAYRYFSIPAIVLKRRTQPPEDNSVTLLCNVILYPNNGVLFTIPEGSFFVPPDPNPHAPTAVKIMSAPWALRATKGPLINYGGPGGYAGGDYNWNSVYDQMMFLATAYNNAQAVMRLRYLDPTSGLYVIVPSPAGALNNDPITGDPTGAIASDFPYPVVAKLTTAIDKFDNWDNSSNTFQIVIHNIGPSDIMMQNIVACLAAHNDNFAIIMINNEIFTVSHGFFDSANSSLVYNAALKTATFTAARRGICDTVAGDHAVNDTVYIIAVRGFDTAVRGFPIAVDADFLCTGLAYPKGVLTESDIGAAFSVSAPGTDRSNRPLRPHNTLINGSRGTATPTALALGATPTIAWKIRGRSVVNSFDAIGKDFPAQTAASQVGEVFASKHIVYRVMIEDNAAVEWDCGATADTADHSSLVATIPLLAAPGDGWLWVQAEFDGGGGVKTSLYQDRLPITLS